MASLSLRPWYIMEPGLDGTGETFTGTAGDDTQDGTAGDDVFKYGQGGNDILDGRGGNDVFRFGAELTAIDAVDGGGGDDTLILDGDYSSVPLVMENGTITDIETIIFSSGNDYDLTLRDTNIGAGKTLTVDASALGPNKSASLDARGETDGVVVYKGGDGFDVVQFGETSFQASTGGGDDLALISAGLDEGDAFNGGAGLDTFLLFISASQTLTLAPDTIRNVEQLSINPAASVGDIDLHLITDDANVGAGQTMAMGFGISTGSTLTISFDGSAETDGHFVITGTSGDDNMTGGAGDDTFNHNAPGNEEVFGGAGDDTINMRFPGGDFENPSLTPDDRLFGGGGFDTLNITGDFSDQTLFESETFQGIEQIVLDGAFNYNFGIGDDNVAKGKTLIVDGSALDPDRTLRFFALDNDSFFNLTGGAGDDILFGGSESDTIVGGAGDDYLVGLGGADTLRGGVGADTYDCNEPKHTSGPNHDIIIGFDFQKDVFAVSKTVKGIDPTVDQGRLRIDSFDSDLADAIGAAELIARHAVLFTPDDGDLAGHIFLIVDANGTAGYQANKDYVLDLVDSEHLGALSKSDFIVAA
jgi:Ca2+-binding RTX toxin-like protein